MMYLGNYAEDAIVYIMFNTFSSDDPAASVTITNFINTDVHIHKDDGLTQRNNAAGITVSTDFDGITGSHLIKIDTSDDTVVGFWVTGSDYFVRIEGTTVDGGTVNAVVAQFSIENRFAEVDVTKWSGTAVVAPDTVGYPKVTIKDGIGQGELNLASGVVDSNPVQLAGVQQSLTDLKDFVDAGYDPATNKVQGVVLTDTVTTLTGHTAQTGDTFAQLPTNFSSLSISAAGLVDILQSAADKVWSSATRTLTAFSTALALSIWDVLESAILTASSIGLKLKNNLDAAITSRQPSGNVDLNADQSGVTIGTVTTNTDMRGTDNAALASVCTEVRLSELDAANMPADLDSILGDTNELQGDWVNGGRLDLLLDAIKVVTDNVSASAGTNVTGTAAAGTLSTTQMTTDLTEITNDHYNGRIIIWTSGVLQNQATDITDYTGATKMLTYTAVTEAPTAGDTFVIV